jgi:hypothetical protein
MSFGARRLRISTRMLSVFSTLPYPTAPADHFLPLPLARSFDLMPSTNRPIVSNQAERATAGTRPARRRNVDHTPISTL